MSPRAADLPPDAEVLDPVFGVPVRVPQRAFRKIARDHPGLSSLSRRVLLAAIRDADVASPDPDHPGRHRYYASGISFHRWLLVIVEYDRDVGEAFNAFGVRRLPRRGVRIR